LANSESAIWAAMLGAKSRSKPRCLIGFRASSSLIVDFANSVMERAGLYAKAEMQDAPPGFRNIASAVLAAASALFSIVFLIGRFD